MANKTKRTSGQALLISVVMMGGALLGAAAIAGVLMLYQIRQANNAADSAKALFAADAGLEWNTYCVFVAGTDENGDCLVPRPAFDNGASFTASIDVGANSIHIASDGLAGDSVRSLESTFRLTP